MTDYSALFTGFNVAADQRITQKNLVNSITPVDVGETITDFSDLLLPIVNTINNFDILSGSLPPNNANGNDFDEYFEFGTDLIIYKKYDGIWVKKAQGNVGISIVDGNISLQTSVSDYTVTVTPGQWGIDNVIYQKATQTQFTVDDPDLNYNRIDAVFADNTGSITYVAGVASSSPAGPATPAGSILVANVFVPSGASTNLPYIPGSNTPPQNGSAPTRIIKAGSDVDADGNLDLSDQAIPEIAYQPSVYVNDIAGAYATQYNKSTKIIMGLYGVAPDDVIEIIF